MTVAITRVLAVFVGFILLLLGVGMLIFPELLASALFAVSARAVGTSALRSDFGALFLGMGGFCLVGVFSRFRWLLLVPSVFLLLVIVGRVISALVDKFSAWPIEILPAELLFLVVLLLAVLSYSRSSKDRTRPAGTRYSLQPGIPCSGRDCRRHGCRRAKHASGHRYGAV